jgi:hypothetical protein
LYLKRDVAVIMKAGGLALLAILTSLTCGGTAGANGSGSPDHYRYTGQRPFESCTVQQPGISNSNQQRSPQTGATPSIPGTSMDEGAERLRDLERELERDQQKAVVGRGDGQEEPVR